ncbi:MULTISPECIES: nucleotidyltransferase domain-containing protein [unclassified Oceanispirochaeta]|uniref:nucleotidyltransferase domain-containing protein n=1 Tax=unclassified Oceanispirochaeta TaxID=2635722 RepID=UPI0013148C2A|nr:MULTISPECIES: nucleotidyltransferase domain-containing protein [unclassified Oceanispirochaeta]MBF9018965.1 nucleotidyltransferase domain-containing protein [Oceanispirochaeta sp. M2]NPD75465.1 nucleotidyltransferase domain-containing protein [Oceanispirochaeta sp. M1]
MELLLNFEQLVAVLDSSAKIQTMFIFGSMARGELTANSDIDVFVVTELTVSEMEDFIKQDLNTRNLFTDSIRNKLTLRYEGNLLIEINCVRNIAEAASFYREAKIKNISQSLYIGTPADIKVLEGFCRIKVDEKVLMEDLISEIFYFICSLPGIMNNKDEYKFYFHGNIILHDFVRIRAILSGVKDKKHLPAHSKDFLSEGYNVLFPPYEGNLQNYIDDTITCFRECLTEVGTVFDIDTSKYSDFPFRI